MKGKPAEVAEGEGGGSERLPTGKQPVMETTELPAAH